MTVPTLRRQLLRLAWVALPALVAGPAPAAAQQAPAPGEAIGSRVPCAVPLGWRVDRVDEGFDLSREEVEDAVRTAVRRWEGAAGRDLFVHDPSDGMPVRLIYGPRQEALRARQEARDEMQGRAGDLRARRAELGERREALAEAWEAYRRRQRELERRVDRYNQRAEDLRSRGDVTEAALEELRRQRERIEEEQRALARRQAELRERERRLMEAVDSLNRSVDDFNRWSRDRGAGASRVMVAEAGRYRERIRMRGDRIVGVQERAVEIYQAAGPVVLARVVAHELGHALGLGHAADSSAVMAARSYVDDVERGGFSVRPVDVEMLREACR